MLLARRQAVLDEVAAAITDRTGVQTRTLAVDLAKSDATATIADNERAASLVLNGQGIARYMVRQADGLSAREQALPDAAVALAEPRHVRR